MAEDDGGFENKVYFFLSVLLQIQVSVSRCTSDSPPLPVMNITTADARLGDLHADIVRIFECGYWPVLEDDVFDGTEDERGIRFLVVQLSGV